MLESYYMPCKAKIFLADLDETRCVTVLRQLLRCADRCVVAFEKSCGAGKLTYYSIRKQVDPSLRMKITCCAAPTAAWWRSRRAAARASSRTTPFASRWTPRCA